MVALQLYFPHSCCGWQRLLETHWLYTWFGARMQRLANIITGRKNFRRPEACQPIVNELTAIV